MFVRVAVNARFGCVPFHPHASTHPPTLQQTTPPFFRYFKRESSASTVFGITLSLAGLLGTPLGGLLIDRQRRRRRLAAHPAHTGASEEAMLACILRQNALLSLAGAVCCCLSCFVYDRTAFLLAFVLGALLLFVCTAGINLCTMLAVPPANRSFAIAVRCVRSL